MTDRSRLHETGTDDGRLRRSIETAVLAPIGAAAYAAEVAPGVVTMLVARGRAEVERGHESVARRIRHARGMGEVALAFGWPRVRARARSRVEEVRRRVEAAVPTSPARAPASPTPMRANGARSAPSGPPTSGPELHDTEPTDDHTATARASLPIPGYDSLSASQVVERLDGLGPDELDAVRDYETSHRGRRTILGKIDQLV